METRDCYDVLGIGFGPANIALAVAMEETAPPGADPTKTVRFIEAGTDPQWQGGMLLSGST